MKHAKGETAGTGEPSPKGRSFFSFLRSGQTGTRAPQASRAVAAMLGLAGPVAAGTMTGHAGIGIVASLGGLALSGEGRGETFREQAPGLIYALIAGSAAVLTGRAMAGHGTLISFGVPAIAAAAGLLGGLSRSLARATTQFMLYTIIAANLGLQGDHPLGAMLLFLLGAAWTAGLSLGLRPLFQAVHSSSAAVITGPQSPRYSARQLVRRWRKSLLHLAGWQYALRITLCLAVAAAFERIWPLHHGYWVSITVLIVVQRTLPAALPRALQRAAGTAFGILLTCLLLLGSSSEWTGIAMIAALAAARPILRETNYTAYAAVMTPLVILLLDYGQEPSWGPVIDRLAATLAGCLLALTLGTLAWFRFFPSPDAAVASKGPLAIGGKNRIRGSGQIDAAN